MTCGLARFYTKWDAIGRTLLNWKQINPKIQISKIKMAVNSQWDWLKRERERERTQKLIHSINHHSLLMSLYKGQAIYFLSLHHLHCHSIQNYNYFFGFKKGRIFYLISPQISLHHSFKITPLIYLSFHFPQSMKTNIFHAFHQKAFHPSMGVSVKQ